jgi:acyl carrier protein
MKYVESLRDLLSQKNYGHFMPADFSNTESLLTRGVVDSFGLFALIKDLENTFNITIENRHIHPGHFETIEKINLFLEKKLRGDI